MNRQIKRTEIYDKWGCHNLLTYQQVKKSLRMNTPVGNITGHTEVVAAAAS
jgi:hypothetical protein